MPKPIILSTWSFGKHANAAGWPHLTGPALSSLDAVEAGCRVIEADLTNHSVGRGGYPDRSGQVSLDASIMLSPSQCGSVCYVRRFTHAITIARWVMERTPHVMLAGEGADGFAKLHGMEPEDLLTEPARQAWEAWVKEHPQAARDNAESYLAPANIEERLHGGRDEPVDPNADHDTVGVLAQNARGVLAGACSTSGVSFKVPGRVGDSPIIGHGMYVDPDHGAAVATGNGELVMGVCGSFLAVELMRRGASPLDAACEVLQRVIDSYDLAPEHQVAMIALRADGEWANACLRPGYSTAVRTETRDEVVPPDRVMLP